MHSDKQVVEDLNTLSSYIKDELNTLEFEIREDEVEFVEYISEPDHKGIGQALKNKYTKELKEKLVKLSREEIVEYLKNGKVTINGVEILEGWLKISKKFNDKYSNDKNVGVDSSLDMSVLLDITLNDNLKQMGMSREIVNKVQKLRKTTGLHIDDQVEIFYEVVNTDNSTLKNVVEQNLQSIRSAVKIPFLHVSRKDKHFVKIAETEYVNPDNERDIVRITICSPNIAFDDEKLKVSSI